MNRILSLAALMSIFGGTLSADPYYCNATSLGGGCWYQSASKLYRCDGESVDLWARSPSGFNSDPACDNPTYQWRKWTGEAGGIAYPVSLGVSTNKITITTAGQYDCVVSCSDGSSYTTGSAFIYFSDPNVSLSVSVQPENDAICLGEQAAFSVSASGGTIKYSWQEKEPLGSWQYISGASGSAYGLVPDITDDQKEYRCHLYNGCESLYSSSALLTVHDSTLITGQPSPDTVCPEGLAGFSISARGSELVYGWQEKQASSSEWSSLADAGNYDFDQSGNLTIQSAASSLNGNLYRAIISGLCPGTADTSQAAGLYLTPAPSFNVQPENDTACVEGHAVFTVAATGSAPLSYKWVKGGSIIKDWSTDTFLVVENLSLDDNQDIQVLLSDACYSQANPVQSDLARLVVDPPPFVNLGDDQRICSGSSTLLNAGNGFEKYEWSNGDSTASIEVAEQGTYSVTVTDQNGCTAGDQVYIIVDPAIGEVNLGSDTSICQGSEISMDAGPGFDNYLWSDGSSTQSISAAETGTYWVKTWNNNSVCEAIDSLDLLVARPYDSSSICLITIDQSTGNFLIIWERTPDKGIAQYNIYREGEWINSVAYDGLSIFTDPDADPKKRPYRYEMTVTDTCGNESAFTPYHIPIFLQYSGYSDGVNLSWEKYQVEGGNIEFSSYSVYKGSDSTQLTPIEENIPTEVSVFIDTDPTAVSNTFYYRIAGVLSEPCIVSGGPEKASTGPYTHALSNLDDNKQAISSGLLGPNSVSRTVKIYPNPAQDAVTIALPGTEYREYQLIITDLTGKVHRMERIFLESDHSLDISRLEQGYYMVSLIGNRVYKAKLVVR